MNNNIIVIANVSTSHFSVARHCGGININRRLFSYCPERDILIRDDWMKFYHHMPWNAFVTAVKTGIKPTRLHQKKEKANNHSQLFEL